MSTENTPKVPAPASAEPTDPSLSSQIQADNVLGIPVIDDTPPEDLQAAVDAALVLRPDEVAASETKEEVSDGPVLPARAPQNVTQVVGMNMAKQTARTDVLNLPSDSQARINSALEQIPNVNLLDNPKSRDWAESIKDALGYTVTSEGLVRSLEAEGADFRNSNEVAGQKLDAAAPRFNEITGQNLKGERAVVRMITHLGLGTIFQVPLFHSGMWITFKPPSESEIVEIGRLINAEKARLGRASYGLIFSNMTAYMTDLVVDFALNHIYDLTVKSEDINTENIREHISAQDIPSLLWGFVNTMYPDGFRYRRACTCNPEKCNHVAEDTINVAKLQWTNLNALTAWQQTHMAGRQPKSKDLATIKRYQDELVSIRNERVQISTVKGREVFVTFKTPSCRDYFTAGHTWIGEIVAQVAAIQEEEITQNERRRLVLNHQQATAMRTYSHWVHSLEFGDGNIIDDLETIQSTLNQLSSDDEIRDTFNDKVKEYIDRSTISVIGIPVYDCPNCGETQKSSIELPHHADVIPLDVVQTFFGLISQRLNSILDR